ncbi:MAG: glycoside hydrolase family 15 [Bacteroidales bacterium]|nr:glycoside hydrolase family 15 [Bacteroidales bacterium]
MTKENLYDVWARRNPTFEKKFKETIIKQYTEYGGGSVDSMTSKGKIFSAGYEIYIYAFFIGLYSNKRKKLAEETDKFGQPIQFWGNLDSKRFRKAYPKLRDYIFTALIAKTDELDLIALEKGEITDRKAVDYLINTMEEYANFGFNFIEEKMKDYPNHFYKNTGFLDIILDLVKANTMKGDIDTIEDL